MNIQKVMCLLVSAIALAGCQTINLADTVTTKAPTAEHKKLLIGAAKESLYDPYSVRDAELSNQLRFPNGEIAYCGRLNSKNALGGYTGRQYVMASFKNNILVSYTPNHLWCKTNQNLLGWNRFRELENL